MKPYRDSQILVANGTEETMMNSQRLQPPQSASATPGVLLMLVAVGFWLMIGYTASAAVPAGGSVGTGNGSAMHARHEALRDQLASNPFNRPLILESSQTSSDVKGDIFAVVPYSFEKVSAALAAPQDWCEILILHLNTKYCGIVREPRGLTLLMNVGKKINQPLDESYRISFAWRLTDQKTDYLRVLLTAESGPFSTRDYRILLEAVPLENGATFLRLSYSYGFGLTGKIAMLAYLGTVGRGKVGFSILGTGADGQPAYIDGMRGQLERNTMRYYLAIESFLGAPAATDGQPFEKRINDWFNAIERYPRQLHELEQAEYLEMKRKEYLRQQLGEKTAALG